MHVLFRESHGLEETATPQDLGQSPADLVVLSFSDSDLGAFAAGWHRGREGLPSLRLANLSALAHPLSVDTYIDRTLSGAKGVLIRLIGGASWWSYGVEQVSRLARERGIALAILPADGCPDPALDVASTLPLATLRRLSTLCEAGGEIAAQGALAQLALAAGLYAGPVPGSKTLPSFGFWHPDTGPTCDPPGDTRPFVALPFYRAWLASADTDGIAELIRGFEREGFRAAGLFLPSLKDSAAAAWLRDILPALAPVAIVNTTAFSARSEGASPLEAARVPVFQAIHATSTRAAWQESGRGLSPSDLAMHVALPEVDGRIGAGVISFKEQRARNADLQFTQSRHGADAPGIAATVARVRAWHRLAMLPPAERRVALVLSTYPGKAHRAAHAVGLDVFASAEAMLEDLREAGHSAPSGPALEAALDERVQWPLASYRHALQSLPEALQAELRATHGDVAGADFAFHATRRGNLLLALQPERGGGEDREDAYHDTTRVPCHAYAAFYLWLREQVDAIVHIGAHGTLEWLPGKAAALSPVCWPQALTGAMPVIYPFIVNDPGEAAQARRRLGAVTLGHLPPPLAESGLSPELLRIERLLDEYSTADGLDPPRRTRLISAIREEAQRAGIEDDLGLPGNASAAEAIPRIDRFVCDVKESQFGEGLHIWGRGTPQAGGGLAGDRASVEAEQRSLPAALSGKPILPGPSGSPYRGRSDVLPTGRNMYGTDPRAVPSRAAHAQGVKLAEELVRRHLQDRGDYPRGLVVNLWGSATMRTAGEDFAMALHLAGVRPVWDDASDRLTGYEIIPLALMDRPRTEVTLRVSGLFRDVFPDLAQLFEAAIGALALRDEAADMNPYVASPGGPRVFCPKPGSYGLGITLGDLTEDGRQAAGEAWLAASAHDANGAPARAALEERLRNADSFVHTQDLPETDLLLAEDYAAHEAGFAAAMARIGAMPPALYHLDATRPERPRARPLAEEIARVVRARASHPAWIRGMMRHGFRGAAEIAATLDHMAAFAHLAGVVPTHLFDLYHAATLDEPDVRAFLAHANPAALDAMEGCFAALAEAGLWRSRSNSRAAGLT
ncbi:cobalamin biosynthesis protein CobN [Haematobacter missouriensis]|uniref:Cobaltochelatase subunit CobN n=1 Tax=Haematobacter missouriensis TaxID=366616 RepID=A0A212ALN1_9RHOB|nr:cobaltochelatase subunit CobN [Haematobacter missouriensis]KFI32458.1 cobalamin biosynthesis protein CobN [Haematobacter missouriensis]OWJ76472.1 cobaltochelatase subunit CobN [Haematobacter missouriensis]OWJ82256.1 cobaltochelatase subunit CobN [Haematobacter missouriensis]